MQTSFNAIQKFLAAAVGSRSAVGYLGVKGNNDTKLGYAIGRISKQVQPLIQKFTDELNEQLQDIALENCLTDPPNDPNGKVIKEGGTCARCGTENTRYVFNKEGERNYKKAQSKLWKEATAREDITVEPYFATSIPDGLTDEQLEAFSGFVIKSEDVERLKPESEETKLSAVA